MSCGGPTAPREADAEVQALCDQVRGDLEGKTNRQFSAYQAVQVTSQVVAGTNFFVKLHVGNEEYLHLRIFRPLPGQGEPELHSHQGDKSKDDQLAYF